MRNIPKIILLLIAQVCCFLFAAGAAAQSASLVETGVNYNYARTNASPGNCGCISMQGGAGWISLNLSHSLGLVGEVSSQHAANIGPFSANLTIISFMGGMRYKRKIAGPFWPFGHVLVGGAHANGSMAPGNPGIPGSSNAFAMAVGGGVDITISRLFAIRMIQADYYYTRFENGVNSRQNNLRLGAGVFVRFGSR